MGLGFELSEVLKGRFYRFDEPLEDRTVRIDLRLAVDGLRRFARERRIFADGVIVAERLAENGGAGKPVSGMVVWKLHDEKRIPYALSFEGDDGKTYHLRGQRDFFFYDALGSLAALEASLYDDDHREIGRAVFELEPRTDLPRLARSFRPRVRFGRLSRARSHLERARSSKE